MSHEQDTKITTVLEVRYRGNVLFHTQIDGILNDADLVVETDIRQLPTCESCKKAAVWDVRPEYGLCKKCRDREAADDDAATQQMFDIGYW